MPCGDIHQSVTDARVVLFIFRVYCLMVNKVDRQLEQHSLEVAPITLWLVIYSFR